MSPVAAAVPHVVEARARREARDGGQVPHEGVQEAGADGRPHLPAPAGPPRDSQNCGWAPVPHGGWLLPSTGAVMPARGSERPRSGPGICCCIGEVTDVPSIPRSSFVSSTGGRRG